MESASVVRPLSWTRSVVGGECRHDRRAGRRERPAERPRRSSRIRMTRAPVLANAPHPIGAGRRERQQARSAGHPGAQDDASASGRTAPAHPIGVGERERQRANSADLPSGGASDGAGASTVGERWRRNPSAHQGAGRYAEVNRSRTSGDKLRRDGSPANDGESSRPKRAANPNASDAALTPCLQRKARYQASNGEREG